MFDLLAEQELGDLVLRPDDFLRHHVGRVAVGPPGPGEAGALDLDRIAPLQQPAPGFSVGGPGAGAARHRGRGPVPAIGASVRQTRAAVFVEQPRRTGHRRCRDHRRCRRQQRLRIGRRGQGRRPPAGNRCLGRRQADRRRHDRIGRAGDKAHPHALWLGTGVHLDARKPTGQMPGQCQHQHRASGRRRTRQQLITPRKFAQAGQAGTMRCVAGTGSDPRR